MSQPRNKPTCGRCGRAHWNFQKCGTARTTGPVIVHRPREGYSEVSDKLGDFERAGTLNGALILRRKNRDPDDHVGSFRP